MSERLPSAPDGAGAAGKRLWRSVVKGFVLDDHELPLRVQAASTADTCEQLQAMVAEQGPMLATKEGTRPNPALIELRC